MFRETDPRSADRERIDRTDDRREVPVSPARSVEPDRIVADRLDLPRGPARERVHHREHNYDLTGSEVRVLATVGAFRVVPADDLARPDDSVNGLRDNLRHLQDVGLVHTVPHVVGQDRTTLVTLTGAGQSLLEGARREPGGDGQQRFYSGLVKPRELAHDAVLYRAYLREAEAIRGRAGDVRRVVLDYELKRDYQRFLQSANRGRRDADGKPNRDERAIQQWAAERHLPIVDNHVQFPDLRIEYDDRDGRRAYDDVEIVTPHYRGRHAAAKAGAGFRRYRATGARLGGGRANGGRGPRITGRHSSRGARGRDVRLAEEFL